MKPAVRSPLLAFHLWTGLLAGIVLLLIALTGAMLVFRDRLERKLDPGRFIVAPGTARLSADELVARGVAARPTAELESVRYYGDPTAAFLVYFKDKVYVHLNPYTGEVLGTRQRYGEGYGWIEGLHKYLVFEPSALGEKVNGGFAIAFACIIVTGFALWWPATRRALRAAVTLNGKLKGRPWNLNLHKTLGFYTGVVLLLSALSGIPVALDSVKNGLYPLTGSTKPPLPVAEDPTAPFVGFEPVARELARIMPHARETYIPLPKKGVVAAYAIAADAPHPMARSYAYYSGADAHLLRHQPYATAASGFRLYYWLLSYHSGLIGGWPVKILMLVAVLSVPVLAYTGLASYLVRRAAKRTREAAIAKPASAASVAMRRGEA